MFKLLKYVPAKISAIEILMSQTIDGKIICKTRFLAFAVSKRMTMGLLAREYLGAFSGFT